MNIEFASQLSEFENNLELSQQVIGVKVFFATVG